MTEIANAARVAAGATFITTVDDMANFYAHLSNCDTARDVFTAWVGDELVGYGRCSWSDLLDGGRVFSPICFVAPAWQRHGIGAAMLQHPRSPCRRDRTPPIRSGQRRSRSRRTAATRVRPPCWSRPATPRSDMPSSCGGPTSRTRTTPRCRPTSRSGRSGPSSCGPSGRRTRRPSQDHWGASQRSEEDWIEFSSSPRPGSDALAHRVGGRPGRRTGAQLHQRRGEPALRPATRVGRTHQRPPSVATSRRGACAHRGEPPVAPRARHDRRRAPCGRGEPLRRVTDLREHGLQAVVSRSGLPQAAALAEVGNPADTWREGRPGHRTSPNP